jgi:hypothetical protein
MGFDLGTEKAGKDLFNCISKAGESPYMIQVDHAGKNKLTNLMSEKFTISELEVWEVICEKRSQSSKM